MSDKLNLHIRKQKNTKPKVFVKGAKTGVNTRLYADIPISRNVSITTMIDKGKYHNVKQPGIKFKIPFKRGGIIQHD